MDHLQALARRLSDSRSPPVDAPFFRRSLALIQQAPGHEPAMLDSFWSLCIDLERLDLVQALIDAGARLEREHHASPLSWAIRKGSLGACEILLNAGADPNRRLERFDPPLTDAIRQNRPDIALRLLEAGANPNPALADASGMPPIHWAIQHGDEASLAALLARGADPLAPGLAGFAPLAVADFFKRPACAGLIQSFLEAQAIERSLPPSAPAPKTRPLSI